MNTAPASRLEPTRRTLIFWALFQDLAFSGAALLIINGLTNLTAAELLLARGCYGLHRGEMPIEPLAVDLSAYAQMTICSPIWVFSLAAPVRSFFRLGVYR